MPTLQQIPLSQIRPDPGQPRKHFDSDHIASLAASLAASGQLQAISVRPANQDGIYTIIAGECRFRAASGLGWETIRAEVCDGLTERHITVLQFVENIQRRDLVPSEEAKALERMLDSFTLPELAAETGLSEDRIRLYLRMLDAPSDAIQLIDAGKMSVEVGARIAALPPEKRPGVLKTIVGKGMGKAEVLQFVTIAAEAKPAPSQQHFEFTVERNHEVILKAEAVVDIIGPELAALWRMVKDDPEALIEAIQPKAAYFEQLFRVAETEFARLRKLASKAKLVGVSQEGAA